MKKRMKNDSSRRTPEPAVAPHIVLIVDDDPDWRLLVRDVLQHREAAAEGPLEVREAENGQAAFQFLTRKETTNGPLPAQLIYLDCEMPRVDGMTLLALLRQNPRLQKIPVVMLTGVTDAACMRRAAELGAVAWIVKPRSVEKLKRVLAASARHWLSPQPRLPARNPNLERAA